MKLKLTDLDEKQLLSLDPKDVTHFLTKEEVLHIFQVLNGFWSYDYQAAEEGRVGYHARLKSEECSDGFFFSKIVLQYDNLRQLIAKQMATLYLKEAVLLPDYVLGIPDGAKQLGDDVARILNVEIAEMQKVDGKLELVTKLKPEKKLLFVEDFCSKGTGLKEAVEIVYRAERTTMMLPFEMVILNRGGLHVIETPYGHFNVTALVNHRIKSWLPENCPLCKLGSQRIKPKASDENWQLINAAQKKAA